ncbi:MAG: glycyl-radical enzyme activating protein [bacterium]
MTDSNGGARGRILSIGHGTTKDGPGWRSIVYFMRCNYRCLWCSSPHTLTDGPVLLLYPNLEKYPERIAASCPRGAISVSAGATFTNSALCAGCVSLDCVRLCIDSSREAAGFEISAADIVSEILGYRQFHKEYGVTISGGEPTCQWDFFMSLLKELKKHGMHTAVETNGSSPRLPEALPWLDLVICDLKRMDSVRHRELTGQPNETVIKNIETIAVKKHPMWVRIPIVPGLNDGENLELSADFLKSLGGNLKVELLGYHRLGVSNWQALDMRYSCVDAVSPTDDELEKMRDIFRARGLEVIVT